MSNKFLKWIEKKVKTQSEETHKSKKYQEVNRYTNNVEHMGNYSVIVKEIWSWNNNKYIEFPL